MSDCRLNQFNPASLKAEQGTTVIRANIQNTHPNGWLDENDPCRHILSAGHTGGSLLMSETGQGG
jgi:hypothetical protein